MAGKEVEVFRGKGGEPERGFYEAALRDEGITCIAKSSGSVSQHPLTVGPMAEFSILVAAEDENRAREVIQGLQEALESVEQDDRDDESAVSSRYASRQLNRRRSTELSGSFVSEWPYIF